MLTAARPNTFKIVQAIALCRVEPKLHVRTRLNNRNVFKPRILFCLLTPGYDRLNQKFTPPYLSLPRRCRNRLDNRK